MNNRPVYSKYWGKASRVIGSADKSFHLLPYHCLDAAFVAHTWWESSARVRDMVQTCIQSSLPTNQIKAWLLFFVALHDLGKWDLRFQLKSPETWKILHQNWNFDDFCIETNSSIHNYDHGKMGYEIFCRDMNDMAQDNESWYAWISAVTGHHGTLPVWTDAYISPQADTAWIDMDIRARRSWIKELEKMFLMPSGLNLELVPPEIGGEGQSIIAGICSISDWIASQEFLFPYESEYMEPAMYWNKLLVRLQDTDIFGDSGMQKKSANYGGVEALLHSGNQPRQVQCVVSQLPAETGLTIIEAPTGCGKTEAGIAYAWKLLAEGKAESIVFALPTQATANAMFERVLSFAEQLFPIGGSNFVLAHGKSLKNHQFQQLCEIGRADNSQGNEDGKVQCAAWLASSKKRVFLGQVGICTIDQILISVLPVRHSFVRMFGLGRSVLVVDEVHAYDAYMYTLLEEVLARHAAVGGSAILLSATLPSLQKKKLIAAWGGKSFSMQSDYPLITQVTRDMEAKMFILSPDQLPPRRTVQVRLHDTKQETELQNLLDSAIGAAQRGALVGLIFNTVDAAQNVALKLRAQTKIPVDLFHSRFMFADRQKREMEVMSNYGPLADRSRGRILVATQVVEQSLDLDFDWLITELCPVDLLFQRIGRMHRHLLVCRPDGFETPWVDVLIPGEQDYGVSGFIYGDTRVLWRTEKLLEQCGGEILFPEAFRSWVEKVYQSNVWGDEPPEIQKAHEKFGEEQESRKYNAKKLINAYMNPLSDTDERVAKLTRDGEMQLSVLLQKENGELLISGSAILAQSEESIDDACVPVPGTKTWRGSLPAINLELGIHTLRMRSTDPETWEAVNAQRSKITYNQYIGLRRESV
ncbi:MAG: CRISPR-associated helicase/endonuclease Cas3 [Negativicutes bacterium]